MEHTLHSLQRQNRFSKWWWVSHAQATNEAFLVGTTGAVDGLVASSGRRFGRDHQYTAFEVVDSTSWCAPALFSSCPWNGTKVNTGFVEVVIAGEAALLSTPGDVG